MTTTMNNAPLPIKFRHDGENVYPACYVCGRAIRDEKSAQMIVVVNGGSHWCAAEDGVDQDDPGFMGGHPVGPDCYKRLMAQRRESN